MFYCFFSCSTEKEAETHKYKESRAHHVEVQKRLTKSLRSYKKQLIELKDVLVQAREETERIREELESIRKREKELRREIDNDKHNLESERVKNKKPIEEIEDDRLTNKTMKEDRLKKEKEAKAQKMAHKENDYEEKKTILSYVGELNFSKPVHRADICSEIFDKVNLTQSSGKRKSGDSFPNMSDFFSCKKTKSNLFNSFLNSSSTTPTQRNMKELENTQKKLNLNMSLEKLDEFENIFKDLGNLKQNNRISIKPSQPHSPEPQTREPQKLTLKKIQASQSSDKITDSLPVLWEA